MRNRNERTEKTAREFFLEQAAAYFDDMKAATANAPYGQAFNHAEAFALQQGRELIRQSLENILQDQIDEHEKKKETRLCPKCQTKKRHLGYHPKERISAIGKVELERRYDECRPCKMQEHIADEALGLEGRYSVGLRRMAVFAAVDEAYRKASEALKELCGLDVSYNTIREICKQEAPKMVQWQQESSEVQEDFIETPGVVELTTDGTCVNTTEGSREAKVGLISKRALGAGVLPEQWEDRKLPRIGACVAFAAIEEKDQFRKHFSFWRPRLKLGSTGDISVLGDGAAWLWDMMKQEFGHVRGCLDIYHALEHLSDTGKVLYGAGTQEYEQWREETKRELLSGGFEMIEERLNRLEKEKEKDKEKWDDQAMESIRLLRNYLENHRERLCYRERLAEGRAIGSGQVEGACKNLIGKRLKQTWAAWDVERLNHMASLCAIRYSDHWKIYWKHAK